MVGRRRKRPKLRRGVPPSAGRKLNLMNAISSNCDPLDLVETHLIRRAIVEFCRPRRLVRRDLLRVLQRGAIFEVS